MINPAIILIFGLILVWAIQELIQSRYIERQMKVQIKLIQEIREEMMKKDKENGLQWRDGLTEESKEIINEEILREQLMSIVGGCHNCDLHDTHCTKTPCGYGLSDQIIEELIRNSKRKQEEDVV